MAVEAYFEAETVWMADIDKYASLAIEERWKKPNLGDLTKVDWTQVEPIEILTAGYPCQPFSHAGQRKGTNDARHIFPNIMEAISYLRPRLIILENVRGHLSLGFKEVLQRLASAGYDAKWAIVRASDVGAPHQRARLFIIAYTDSHALTESRRVIRGVRGTSGEIVHRSDREKHGSGFEIQRPNTNSFGQPLGENNSEQTRNQGQSQFVASSLGAFSSNTYDKQLPPNRQMSQLGWRFDTRFEMSMRAIPDPLVNGKLNTKYVEYMMGLPEGWVTDLPISRAQQFKMLGNGVVPQQAYYALEILCDTGHSDHDTPKGHA